MDRLCDFHEVTPPLVIDRTPFVTLIFGPSLKNRYLGAKCVDATIEEERFDFLNRAVMGKFDEMKMWF